MIKIDQLGRKTLLQGNFLFIFLVLIIATSSCNSKNQASGRDFAQGAYTPIPTQTTAAVPTMRPTPTPLTSLRWDAEKLDFFIGTAVDPGWLTGEAYAEHVAREFNMVTPETAMKWEVIHPQQDLYDFSVSDIVIEYARENDMLVRGHTLVWDKQLPEWITQAEEENSFTRDEWAEILRDHIHTVVGSYRGQIYAWDVVNEAIDDEGALRDTIWLRVIGPEYIPLAFRWAHEADPYALLFYNDNGGEWMNAKSDAIYSMVESLKQESVPIHGVGMQAHLAIDDPLTELELEENIQRLFELGLRVHITEMDVRLQYSRASEEQKLTAQAELYRMVFSACLTAPACEAFIIWGATDHHSWIPGYTGQPDAPLLFDREYQPKPAYDAIMDVLESGGD